jgi:hypothetical protein
MIKMVLVGLLNFWVTANWVFIISIFFPLVLAQPFVTKDVGRFMFGMLVKIQHHCLPIPRVMGFLLKL